MSAPSDSPESSDPLESPSESVDASSEPPESPDAVPDSSESPTAPERPASPDTSERSGSPDSSDRSDSPDASDSADPTDSTAATDDPRTNDEFVRTVSVPREGEGGDVTLVGVVHDHPASAYRAQAIVRERDPAVVALELPSLAVPLYRAYARDSETPPSFGGEMSAAAQTAGDRDAEVVGVDAPTPEFLARLARNCWDERTSLGTLRRVVSGVASVTRHALVCRAAAAVADRTSLRVEVDDPVIHDCDRSDPPDVQARDEREQARRSQSLLRAFDPPRQVRLRDETREEYMADNVESLSSRGGVVAVVGLDHLDAVADRLAEK